MMNFNFSKIKTERTVIVLVFSLLLATALSVLTLIFLNKNKAIEAQIQDNFIRVCVDPPTPDLSDPTRPIFKWDTFGNAQTNFQLQVDNNPAFGSPEINVSGGAQKSYQPPAVTLPLATTYWYRVNVSDNGSRWTGWTGCNSFYLRGLNPSATDLGVSQAYCPIWPAVILSWTFTDPDPTDFQTAYQVQVDNNSDFSSPEDDSCIPAPGTCNSPNGSNSYTSYLSKLSYGQTYYWRLQVWDRDGYSSGWIYPPSSPGSPTAPPGTSFTTPVHRYPAPNFTFSPPNPTVGEIVYLTDNSKCYSAPGNVEYNCQDSINNRYRWYFDFPGPVDCDSNTNSACRGNTTTTYAATDQYRVRLRVTNDLGSCDVDQIVAIGLRLPEWKEILPY